MNSLIKMLLVLQFYCTYISNVNICIYTNLLSSTTINLQKKGDFQQYWWSQQQIYHLLFGNFGYLGLKYILDKNEIYYAKYHPGVIFEG